MGLRRRFGNHERVNNRRSLADAAELLTETAAYRRFYATPPLDERMRTL